MPEAEFVQPNCADKVSAIALHKFLWLIARAEQRKNMAFSWDYVSA